MTKAKTVDRTDPKALMNFSEYNTFQGFYKITSGDKDQGLDRAFNKCILFIVDWVRSRIEANNHYDEAEIRFLYDYPVPGELLALGYDVFENEDFHLKRAKTQFDIAIFALKEFGEWTIRVREPNNQTDQAHLDWLFTTDIALKMEENYVFLAVRTKCKESHHHSDKALIYRTAFLRSLFEDESLIISEGGISSHDYPMNMRRLKIERSGNAKKDDYEFLKVIKDPGRQMPIVFCPSILDEADEKDAFRIIKLSEHMSGEAYVVIDEQKNGYKDLFKERMTDILMQVGLSSNDAMEMIKTNYLYIEPRSENEKYKWFPMDPAISDIEEMSKAHEGTIKKELKGVENHVYETFYRRNDTDKPDYDHGDVLYYSELWSEYINNSDDSKRLEEALAAKQDAEQRLKELTESHEENVSAKVEEVVKEYSEKLEEGFKREMQSEKARFEEQLRKKEALIDEQRAAIDENKKRIEELEEKLRKSYDYSLENEKLAYLNRFWSKSYKKGALTDWVEENMSDLIVLHGDAVDSYKKWGYPKEDIVRNAFILLYADEMRSAGNITDEQFEAIRTDKTLSVFDIDRSGEDGKKHPVNGHDLDYHVVYSAHTADMFRIYYYRDKNLGKIVIGYIGKHL